MRKLGIKSIGAMAIASMMLSVAAPNVMAAERSLAPEKTTTEEISEGDTEGASTEEKKSEGDTEEGEKASTEEAPPANLISIHQISGSSSAYAAVLYDNTNGLPTSEANAVLQTSDGFMWFGCYSGLIRFDGSTFERYDSSTGLTSVVSLFEDSKHRLWVGTNDNGVGVIEKEHVTIYEHGDALKSASVRAMAEDENGNIIIGTTHGLGYVDANMELHGMDEPQLNDKYINGMQAGSDGKIYGVTNTGDVFRIFEGRVEAFLSGDAIEVKNINSIYPDPDHAGYVYLGTTGSKLYYGTFDDNFASVKEYELVPAVNINSMIMGEDRLWIGSDTGIGFLQGNQYYHIADIPMNNSVDCLTMDHENNLWAASSRQGVLKVVPNLFMNISEVAGLPELVVNSTCMRGSDLYIGTDTGLYVLDQDYNTVENEMTELLDGTRIRTIISDSKGRLWFATYSDYGLVCLNKDGSYETYTEEDGLNSNRVRMLKELSDGSMLVASSGINRIENGKVTLSLGEEQGITNTSILTIEEGPDGKWYLGSDGDGIYVVDGANVTRLSANDGLSSGVVLRLKKDPTQEDLYWVITSNSIGFMRDEQITTVSLFPYVNNFDLYFDNGDNLWILASNGIYIVNRDNLLANGEIDYRFFDFKGGLPCVATANSRSYLSDAGDLYIAGSTGVSVVNINAAEHTNGDIRLVVTSVEADNEVYFVENGHVTIPSSCKRLTIHGYAFTYTLQNPVISYQLVGFDEKDVRTTKLDMTSVSYTNLKGGKYQYRLAVVDTNTGEFGDVYTLDITKKKAFYERTWFYLLLAAALLAIIYGIVKYYMHTKTRALLRKQEEDKKYIDEMTNAFAKCIDKKDRYTRGHSFRVAYYTTLLASKLGYSEEEVEHFHNIALLHDIGKVFVPDEILTKPGRLTDEEFEIMRSHAANGYEVLKEITVAPDLAVGAGCHHERPDGKGYPNGYTEEEIPFVAQIIAVADTFDAMYTDRPYRKKMSMDYVVSEFKAGAGTQFNEKVVDAFLALVEEGAFRDNGAES